jgi:hypothetical protein
MSSAAAQIAALVPKLRPKERTMIRSLIDELDYKRWTEDTAKFRQLMSGKARTRKPASKIVSEQRR